MSTDSVQYIVYIYNINPYLHVMELAFCLLPLYYHLSHAPLPGPVLQHAHTTTLHGAINHCMWFAVTCATYIRMCICVWSWYGKVGFPISTLEGITLASSTITLGQVGYIRYCLSLHSITHFTPVHPRSLLILHNLSFPHGSSVFKGTLTAHSLLLWLIV